MSEISPKNQLIKQVLQWFDSDRESSQSTPTLALVRAIPFIIMHLSCFLVLVVGISPVALTVAVFLYLLRMFAITGFYHRYFSHKTFKTSRIMQFLLALIGNSSAQRGPIWWAGHHRHHHRVADTDADFHSPVKHGFWQSHVGWLLTHENFRTRKELAGDWMKFPELAFINRFDTIVPSIFAVALYFCGDFLRRFRPDLRTNGLQLLVWGFSISTVALFHATATINSLSHIFGSRRYETPDTSRNNPLLALITLGEGWHNNHHHYAVSARQGFFWYELDITWLILKVLEKLGLIWDLRPVPQHLLEDKKVT